MYLEKGKNKYKSKSIKRYSESFKLGVLDELSRGESTKDELKRRYHLGNDTINTWIKKYKRKDLTNRIMRIETPEEASENKQLKLKIAELEKALAQTQVEHLKAAAGLSVAAEELGYKDYKDYLKKQEAKQSKKR